jgi:hypothetical protein
MPGAWREFIGRHKEIAHPVCDSFIDVSLERTKDDYLQLVGVQVLGEVHSEGGRCGYDSLYFVSCSGRWGACCSGALTQ